MQLFGDSEAKIVPRLFIHRRCGRLVETLPALQHDPNRPEDVLKVDADAALLEQAFAKLKGVVLNK